MPSVPLISARPSFSARVIGSQTGRRQRLGRRLPFAGRSSDDAFAHQGQGAVRQRGQVTGAAEAAVLGDDRGDLGVEQVHVRGERLRPYTRTSGGQGGDSQQHEGSNDLRLHLGSRPRRVGADQTALQLGAQLDRNVACGQGAEARGHPVVRRVVVGQRLDHRAAASHLGPRLRSDLDRGGLAGHTHDVGEGERSRADGDGIGERVHASMIADMAIRKSRFEQVKRDIPRVEVVTESASFLTSSVIREFSAVVGATSVPAQSEWSPRLAVEIVVPSFGVAGWGVHSRGRRRGLSRVGVLNFTA